MHESASRPGCGGMAIARGRSFAVDRTEVYATSLCLGQKAPAIAREVGVGTHTRGFASMDRYKQREIARKGGKVAHQKGVAHEWTVHEAREAGRKGGSAKRRRKEVQTQSWQKTG
jgi:uncharacterized protein